MKILVVDDEVSISVAITRWMVLGPSRRFSTIWRY